MKKIATGIIEIYQTFFSFDGGLLSIFAPSGACKYTPTCSEYTKQMIKKFGVSKGLILGGKRILSCR